jgi:hypothetical protein
MNRSIGFGWIVALAAGLFLSSSSYASNPWVASVDWSAVAWKVAQPEGVTFTAGEGHVIVDFSEAAKTSDLEVEFLDPLADEVPPLENKWYDISTMPDELRDCLRHCETIADPTTYLKCIDYCNKTFGEPSSDVR